jgi:CheY-like chemotaxis protein
MKGRRRVLFVDDEFYRIEDQMVALFNGCHLDYSQTMCDAILKLSSRDYDLVITDVMLPHGDRGAIAAVLPAVLGHAECKDGLDLVRLVHSKPYVLSRNQSIPVIVFTGLRPSEVRPRLDKLPTNLIWVEEKPSMRLHEIADLAFEARGNSGG